MTLSLTKMMMPPKMVFKGASEGVVIRKIFNMGDRVNRRLSAPTQLHLETQIQILPPCHTCQAATYMEVERYKLLPLPVLRAQPFGDHSLEPPGVK